MYIQEKIVHIVYFGPLNSSTIQVQLIFSTKTAYDDKRFLSYRFKLCWHIIMQMYSKNQTLMNCVKLTKAYQIL